MMMYDVCIGHSTDATVEVSILDVNEEPPEFEDESYSATIAENNALNVTLATVSASDDDYMENGTVSYSLSNNTYLR